MGRVYGRIFGLLRAPDILDYSGATPLQKKPDDGRRRLIEGLSRVPLVFEHAADETEPLYYLPRLVAFSLIVVAVILKNRPSGR